MYDEFFVREMIAKAHGLWLPIVENNLYKIHKYPHKRLYCPDPLQCQCVFPDTKHWQYQVLDDETLQEWHLFMKALTKQQNIPTNEKHIDFHLIYLSSEYYERE